MKKNSLIIATRQSPLAMWQAEWVKNKLHTAHPDLKIELLGLTTTADKQLSSPLYKIGGKGLFVKELEEALLSKKADIAVHSMKDVPMQLPTELCVPVMCEREAANDVFVSNTVASLNELSKSAKIGTSSLRRQSQLLARYSTLKTAFLRGNVGTRLSKLDAGEYDGIILAEAGLIRLGFENRITQKISIEEMLPAAGQGVLGIECRHDDEKVQGVISVLNDKESFICVTAERAMCRYLNAGCQVPVAAYAKLEGNEITLQGLVGQPDGKLLLKAFAKSSNAEQLGIDVAKDLLSQGAQKILNEC